MFGTVFVVVMQRMFGRNCVRLLIDATLVGGDGAATIVFNLLCNNLELQHSFVMMYWCIWKRRKGKVWENSAKPDQILVLHTLSILMLN